MCAGMHRTTICVVHQVMAIKEKLKDEEMRLIRSRFEGPPTESRGQFEIVIKFDKSRVSPNLVVAQRNMLLAARLAMFANRYKKRKAAEREAEAAAKKKALEEAESEETLEE
eukprot:Lankesteria_metandrocarpae@DN514_c0_g1_i1.p2